MAAVTGQAVDTAEQLLLRAGRQIDQQALGNPCRRLDRIKPAVPQSLWPVLTQIDGDLTTLGPRLGAVTGEHLALEIEDLRTVQLENRRSGRPREPVGAGIQSGRQDDYLPHARVRRPAKILVEIFGASALEVDEMLAEVGGLEWVVGNLTVENVGRRTADGATKQLRIRVDGQRVGLLCLQRSRCRYEQRGRTHTRCDVPGITFATHPTNTTPRGCACFPVGRNGNGRSVGACLGGDG